MARLKDQGVCIREGDFSETSQVLSVFTADHGIVRGLAKGARRAGGSFSGGFELLSLGELLWSPKPQGQLATFTSWTPFSTSPAIRASWDRWACAMYLAQLVASLFQEGDPHSKTLDRLTVAIDSPTHGAIEETLAVLWTALEDAGYRIELEADIETGQPLANGVVSFVPERGGFASSPARSDTAWRVRPETVARLRVLRQPRAHGGVGTSRALRLLHAYLREILGREIPSWQGVERLIERG